MSTNISPDQIKTIATAVRKAETDRLGAKLPHTTVLNTVTKALGLAEDFRAYQAAYARPAEPAPRTLKSSTMLFAFPTEYDDEVQDISIMDPSLIKELEAELRSDGFTTVDIFQTQNGWAELYASTTNPSCTQKFLDKMLVKYEARLLDAYTKGALRKDTERLTKLSPGHFWDNETKDYIEKALPWKYAFAWQEFSDARELTLDFRYYDNENQVCSMSLNEHAWKAASDAGLSTEEAAIIIGYDNELTEGYDETDIVGHDLYVSVDHEFIA